MFDDFSSFRGIQERDPSKIPRSWMGPKVVAKPIKSLGITFQQGVGCREYRKTTENHGYFMLFQ